MRCSPRPVSSREPGLCGAGAALPGSATAHSTQGPGCEQAEPDRPPGPGIAGPRQGMPPRAGHKLRHHDRDVWAALCHAPPVQDGDGEVPWRRGPIRDLRRARAWRSAAGTPSARGRDPVMAASCCAKAGHLRGRYQPVPPVPDSRYDRCATITARSMSSRQQNRRVHVPRSSDPRCAHLSWRGAAWRPPRARQARAGFKTTPREWRYRPGFPLICQRARASSAGRSWCHSGSARLAGG